MISAILEFSIRQRVVVILATLGLLGFGIWSAKELPVDAVPDITSPQVQINVEVPALAPEEIEILVTRVLEQELSGLPGLVELRSLTKFGLSQITLQFIDDIDVYRARQLVAERLQAVKADLPPNADAKLTPISTGLGEIFYYTLGWNKNYMGSHQDWDENEKLQILYDAQEYIAKPFLRTISGVAEINSIGGLERQYVIFPDPEKMRIANISFEDLNQSVSANTQNAGGGIIDQNGKRLVVRALSKANDLDEIREIPIKFGGQAIPTLMGIA